MGLVRPLLFTLFLSLSATAAQATESNAPRYRLKQAEAEPVQRGARFKLRARLAPVESAGELREGGDFVLIGRFAKTGVSCDINKVFSNGFEGS